MEASVPASWFETHPDAFAELPCQGGCGRGAGVPRSQGVCCGLHTQLWGEAGARCSHRCPPWLTSSCEATPHLIGSHCRISLEFQSETFMENVGRKESPLPCVSLFHAPTRANLVRPLTPHFRCGRPASPLGRSLRRESVRPVSTGHHSPHPQPAQTTPSALDPALPSRPVLTHRSLEGHSLGEAGSPPTPRGPCPTWELCIPVSRPSLPWRDPGWAHRLAQTHTHPPPPQDPTRHSHWNALHCGEDRNRAQPPSQVSKLRFREVRSGPRRHSQVAEQPPFPLLTNTQPFTQGVPRPAKPRGPSGLGAARLISEPCLWLTGRGGRPGGRGAPF